MSLFITFEGIEGCGKSTQAKALAFKLRQQDVPVVLTHEPGGTPLGREIRHTLKKNRPKAPSVISELLLFASARAQLVTEVIYPKLKEGKIILCDRFADSTLAYQGYGRGIDLDIIRGINALVTQGLKPDLTILLDLPVESGLARRGGKRLDRFEQESLDFHRRVREGYLKLAAEEPERWVVIDATLSKQRIAKIVWEKVSQLLSTKGILKTCLKQK